MDNFELITYNVTHISFCLFELLKGKYSPAEIFAFAARMDADAYAKEGTLETSTIFETVFKIFDSKILDVDDVHCNLSDSLDNNLCFCDAITMVCITTMCLLFPVDNEDMDVKEIVDAVFSQKDRIKKIVSKTLQKIMDDGELDSTIRQNVRYFIWFDDNWKAWNVKIHKVFGSDYKPKITITDIDNYIDSFDSDFEEDEDFDAFVNMVEDLVTQSKKRKVRKSSIVFGILSAISITYGAILLIFGNGLGVMPIFIGAFFLVMFIVFVCKR